MGYHTYYHLLNDIFLPTVITQ